MSEPRVSDDVLRRFIDAYGRSMPYPRIGDVPLVLDLADARRQLATVTAERNGVADELDLVHEAIPSDICGDEPRADLRVQALVTKTAVLKTEAARLRARFPLPVVCICGSTRFADEHAIARWTLERTGRYICVMINYLPANYAAAQGWEGNDHFGEAAGIKEALDDLHKRKIDLADAVLVVAPGGYIGDSTRAEVAYAKGLGRPVYTTESGEAALAALDAKGKP